MNNSEFVDHVLELTNAERLKAGLSPLTLNLELSKAAQTHSQNMAIQDFFNHTGLDGSSPSDRARTAGYLSGVAENIAAGQSTPEEVVQAWMESPGHRENILNPNVQVIGIGYFYLEDDPGNVRYQHYWNQEFGKSEESRYSQSSSSSSNPTETADLLLGTTANDRILALGGNDTLRGGLGDDFLNGMREQDWIFGDAGRDTLMGGKGQDTLCGDEGQDIICGDADEDWLYGEEEDDSLFGGKNNDILDGGLGDDLLCGDLGADTLIGGAGRDRFGLRVDVADLILFKPGEDAIALSNGLTFADLSISQGIGIQANSTLISLISSGQILAILPDVQASQLSLVDFVNLS